MYVVMKIQSFEVEPSPDNKYRLPLEIKIDSGKMIGFLPVYENKDDALKDYPGAELLPVREKTNDDTFTARDPEWMAKHFGRHPDDMSRRDE